MEDNKSLFFVGMVHSCRLFLFNRLPSFWMSLADFREQVTDESEDGRLFRRESEVQATITSTVIHKNISNRARPGMQRLRKRKLVRSRSSAWKDPVAGDGQRSKLFHDVVHRSFAEKSLDACACLAGDYGMHSPTSIQNHMIDLSADLWARLFCAGVHSRDEGQNAGSQQVVEIFVVARVVGGLDVFHLVDGRVANCASGPSQIAGQWNIWTGSAVVFQAFGWTIRNLSFLINCHDQ